MIRRLTSRRTASTNGSIAEKVKTDSAGTVSSSQELIWSLDAAVSGSEFAAGFNLSIAFHLTGDIDVGRLEAAVNCVARRHSVLRQRFIFLEAGHLDAVVGGIEEGNALFRSEIIESERDFEPSALAEGSDCFDLSTGPLFRAVLFRVGNKEDYLLTITFHQIVADEISCAIFCAELSDFYAAGCSSGAPGLPPLLLQYEDYARQQRIELDSDEFKEALRRWKSRLAGLDRLAQLPTDRARSSAGFAGDLAVAEFPENLDNKIRKLAAVIGVSEDCVYLSAFQTLLSIYSGQEAVSVGMEVSTRDTFETGQHLIGRFINPVAILTSLNTMSSFTDAIKATAQAVAEAETDAIVPFQAVVAAMRPGTSRDSAANPLFQVMYRRNFSASDISSVLALPGVEVEAFEVPHLGVSQLDLTLMVSGGPDVALEYSKALFDAKTAHRILDAYIHLLSASCKNPDVPRSQLDLLSPFQKGDVAIASCAPRMPDRLTGPLPYQQFVAQASANPDNPCTVFEGSIITYSQALKRAQVVAAALAPVVKAGRGMPVRIGVMIDRCLELPLAIIAVWLAGGVYVPLDPSFPRNRLEIYVQDAEVQIILTESCLRDAATEVAFVALAATGEKDKRAAKIVVTEDLRGNDILTENNFAIFDDTSEAYIIFTSGTSGRPKGVVCTHGGLRDFIYHHAFICSRSGQKGTYLLSASINFDPHLGWILAALSTGAKLVVAAPSGHADADYIAGLIVREGVTSMEAVPTLAAEYIGSLERVMNLPEFVLDTFVLGGEELTPTLAAAIRKRLPYVSHVINAYGPTETTVGATTWLVPFTEDALRRILIGKTDPNMRAYVVDPQTLAPLPLGAVGELILSGPRLALGYVGRPDLTEKSFVDNPCRDLHLFAVDGAADDMDPAWEALFQKAYRTGDLVSWREEGFLFLGRVDAQVKVNGVRIEMGEVQNALEHAPGVTAAYVTAISEGPNAPKELVAAITPLDIDINGVMKHCRNVLPSAAVPLVQPVSELKRLPSGKVDVMALGLSTDIARAASRLTSGADDLLFVSAETKMEELVESVWREVLGCPKYAKISVAQDFFAAGGSSLKAGMVTSRLRLKLSLGTLPATMVYTSKTIREMAKYIENMQEKERKQKEDYELARAISGLGSDEINSQVMHAEQIDMSLPSGVRIVETQLPYALYLAIQFIFLALTLAVLPLVWGVNIIALIWLRRVLGIGPLFGLWPLMGLVSLFLWIGLLVFLKWILVQRLRPGVYPLYGWMYLRWITLRAVHAQAGLSVFPFVRRTSLLPLLFRLMGAKIECCRDTTIDSFDIFDYDLITIGKGAKVCNAAAISCAYVAPVGMLGPTQVLVLSPVVIGAGCQLGHAAVVPPGTSIPANHNLKPHSSPAHPGCEPIIGGMTRYPHFMPEEHMHWSFGLIGGIIFNLIESIVEIPSLTVCLVLIGLVLGEDPLDLNTGLINSSTIQWKFVIFTVLFSVAFQWIDQPLSVAFHLAITAVWKLTLVGKLNPGRNLTSSKWALFSYAILRKMVESPRWAVLQETFCATPVLGIVYRAFGADIGEQAFLGGLLVAEFDALSVGTLCSAANNSRVYCISDDGVILRVKLGNEASVGNGAVLFPGARLGAHSVIGNDTAVSMEWKVPRFGRMQGDVDYIVDRGSGARDRAAEEALGLPKVVSMSASGVEKVHLSWWHIVFATCALFFTFPITGVLFWGPMVVLASVGAQVSWGLVPPIYIVMVAVGILVTICWLRILMRIAHIERLWKEGSASVFDLHAQLHHSFFHTAHANLYVFQGTPFMRWIYRALGFKVGAHTVLMGKQPLESGLVSFGDGAVVDSLAYVNGHYMEFQRFIYHPVSIGKDCWIQLSSRIMPATVMKRESRVLPGTLVLPGDTIEEGMVWGGLPAEPIGKRGSMKARGKGNKVKVFQRSTKISRRTALPG